MKRSKPRRVERKNELPAEKRECPLCGAEMQTVCFSDGCEYLDVVPAEFVVVQPKDETIRCPNDGATVSADPAPRIVEGGKLGDTLLGEAVCDKFLDHVPIERQATRFARAGVDVAPQTLGRGVLAAIDVLEPVAIEIEERTRGPGVLGTDASTIPILDPEVPTGIRNGAMWVWTNARWVSFLYSPSGAQTACGASSRAMSRAPCNAMARPRCLARACRNRCCRSRFDRQPADVRGHTRFLALARALRKPNQSAEAG